MAPLAIIATTTLLKSAFPKAPFLLAAATSTTTTTALQQSNDDNGNTHCFSATIDKMKSPRVQACTCMATAMALHFGGYEFARSGALALFTSSETGLVHPSAYPLAIGMVTPVSLTLLYWYGLMVKSSGGPRKALSRTTLFAVAMLTLSIAFLQITTNGSMAQKVLVTILFIFQNSYAHLLYTQQWSFLGSVMTPTEGTKWFSSIAGLSSLVCTMTATCVPTLASTIGLKGLILGTSLTLTLSLLFADRAYRLGEENGFDPTPELQRKETEKDEKQEDTSSSSPSLVTKTVSLFQRVPTLAALFGEVIAFQSLSTILNLCFVRTLKQSMPHSDTNRASYTGRFYAYINGMSGLMQFCVLPLARKYLEPKWVYVLMPLLLLPWLAYTTTATSLWMVSAAFFSLKTLDYSLRNVVNEMVYQPLDFESRYVGKEVIGVFANRFGKSGMSILLSMWTASTVTQLSQCSVVVGGLWSCCSWWLSRNVVSNQEAEARVEERRQKKKD